MKMDTAAPSVETTTTNPTSRQPRSPTSPNKKVTLLPPRAAPATTLDGGEEVCEPRKIVRSLSPVRLMTRNKQVDGDGLLSLFKEGGLAARGMMTTTGNLFALNRREDEPNAHEEKGDDLHEFLNQFRSCGGNIETTPSSSDSSSGSLGSNTPKRQPQKPQEKHKSGRPCHTTGHLTSPRPRAARPTARSPRRQHRIKNNATKAKAAKDATARPPDKQDTLRRRPEDCPSSPSSATNKNHASSRREGHRHKERHEMKVGNAERHEVKVGSAMPEATANNRRAAFVLVDEEEQHGVSSMLADEKAKSRRSAIVLDEQEKQKQVTSSIHGLVPLQRQQSRPRSCGTRSQSPQRRHQQRERRRRVGLAAD